MAFRDPSHREEVYRTPEYRKMVREWAANKAPVPLYIFQKAYGNAFWDRKGNSERPGRTATSRTAFLNLMKWTGRAPNQAGYTWDDWENDLPEVSP